MSVLLFVKKKVEESKESKEKEIVVVGLVGAGLSNNPPQNDPSVLRPIRSSMCPLLLSPITPRTVEIPTWPHS